jgi:hypothetical protein
LSAEAKRFGASDKSFYVFLARFYVAAAGRNIDSWTQTSPPNFVERSNILLGHTIDELRVYWFLSGIKGFENGKVIHVEGNPHAYRVIGYGQAGIIAAYAAQFEPAIKEIVLVNPPRSHKDGPHFPGILRVLDVPDALGLLAPRPLTIIGDDPAFDRTAEIYRLAGAADKLKRVK